VINLIDLQVFVKLAELRGVTAASNALGMPKSSVSRGLTRLEADLGASLVQRSGKHFTLTDTGRLFHGHALRILGDVQEAESTVHQLGATPRGHLRVCAPVASGRFLLAPLLPEFLKRYPEVSLALELTSRQVDPADEQVDVVVHVGPLPDSRLVARKLGQFPLCLYGSPDYIARSGMPGTVKDLARHTLLDIFEGPHDWTLDGPSGQVSMAVVPKLSVNDPSTVKVAAVAGLGLAWLPSFVCAEELADGSLVRVLPQWQRGVREVHALFPRPRVMSPRVRALVDFLVERLSGDRHARESGLA
jgi:DNA-binding transcriptional LysR family regulator